MRYHNISCPECECGHQLLYDGCELYSIQSCRRCHGRGIIKEWWLNPDGSFHVGFNFDRTGLKGKVIMPEDLNNGPN